MYMTKLILVDCSVPFCRRGEMADVYSDCHTVGVWNGFFIYLFYSIFHKHKLYTILHNFIFDLLLKGLAGLTLITSLLICTLNR